MTSHENKKRAPAVLRSMTLKSLPIDVYIFIDICTAAL